MNKKTYSIILAFLPALAFGQLTINNAENFTIGTVLKFQGCDTTGIKPGLPGPKETWDFSHLVPSGNPITETMVVPGSTPYAQQFPGANSVEKYSDGRYVFVQILEKQSQMIGFVSPTMQISYPKPLVFAKRPVNLGGNNTYPFTDKYSISGSEYNGKGNVIIAADGAGTLIMPDKKKYTNVLRVKITQKQSDVIGTTNKTTNMEVVTYVWFDDKHKSALLKISTVSSPTYNNKTVEYLISEEDK